MGRLVGRRRAGPKSRKSSVTSAPFQPLQISNSPPQIPSPSPSPSPRRAQNQFRSATPSCARSSINRRRVPAVRGRTSSTTTSFVVRPLRRSAMAIFFKTPTWMPRRTAATDSSSFDMLGVSIASTASAARRAAISGSKRASAVHSW